MMRTTRGGNVAVKKPEPFLSIYAYYEKMVEADKPLPMGQRIRPSEQVRSLWCAVLASAYEARTKKQKQEVYEWLMAADGEECMGGFLWICEMLNLPASKIKKDLIKVLRSKKSVPHIRVEAA